MKKETIKTLVIGILAGVIIAGGTGTVIAYSVNSNNVNFRSTDSAWKVNTVAEAIDDLYIKKTGDNYSTEERVVGTWIDGKPIYQKTIQATLPSSSGTIDPHLSEYVDVIEIYGWFLNSYNNYIYFSPDYNAMEIYYSKETNKLNVNYTSSAPWAHGRTAYITIKYTKNLVNNNNEG